MKIRGYLLLARTRVADVAQSIHASGNVDLWLVKSADAEIYIPAVGDEVVSVTPGVGVVVSDG